LAAGADAQVGRLGGGGQGLFQTVAGQAQAVDALPTVGTVVCGREPGCGQERAQVFLELGESGLTEGADGPAARGGQAGKNGVVIGRYLYRLIDRDARLFAMTSHPSAGAETVARYPRAYDRLRAQLAQVGWISEGYVQDRGPGAGGPCYQWTRKVKGKTVSVALSREQFEWLREAIAQWRTVQSTLRQMQRLSREVLFQTVPHPPRRKRLGKRVLGLI
jgi:hypothetical protein